MYVGQLLVKNAKYAGGASDDDHANVGPRGHACGSMLCAKGTMLVTAEVFCNDMIELFDGQPRLLA